MAEVKVFPFLGFLSLSFLVCLALIYLAVIPHHVSASFEASRIKIVTERPAEPSIGSKVRRLMSHEFQDAQKQKQVETDKVVVLDDDCFCTLVGGSCLARNRCVQLVWALVVATVVGVAMLGCCCQLTLGLVELSAFREETAEGQTLAPPTDERSCLVVGGEQKVRLRSRDEGGPVEQHELTSSPREVEH